MQTFERARFEYHPENPAAFKVQLGLLGREETVIETLPQAIAPAVSALSNGTPTAPVILPESDLRAFRYKMPTPGYWMASADGMVASVGSFQYMRVLKGYAAPKGKKFVVFAITKRIRELNPIVAYMSIPHTSPSPTSKELHAYASQRPTRSKESSKEHI